MESKLTQDVILSNLTNECCNDASVSASFMKNLNPTAADTIYLWLLVSSEIEKYHLVTFTSCRF